MRHLGEGIRARRGHGTRVARNACGGVVANLNTGASRSFERGMGEEDDMWGPAGGVTELACHREHQQALLDMLDKPTVSGSVLPQTWHHCDFSR